MTEYNKELIRLSITILQVIVFVGTMYLIINSCLNQWESIGMKPKDMPVESLCVGSFFVSIFIVSLVDGLRTKIK